MSTKSSSKAAIVIPNWNGADLIKDCVDSLLGQTIPVTIIVVENGSVDNSLDILKRYGSKIILLPQDKNLGFAGGVNKGIQYALDNNYDFVGLINNDAVADKKWAEELLKGFAIKDNVSTVASKMLKNDKKTIDSVANGYTIFGSPYPIGRNEIDYGQYNGLKYVFGASGGAVMYKAKIFKEIGLFDEDFFAYYEEDDLNFRAALHGYLAIAAPKAIVYHAVGSTSGKIKGFTVYQTAKNFWPLYIKNMPMPLFLLYLPLAMSWYVLMFANRTLSGNFTYFIKGWLDSSKKIAKTYRKRREVQKSNTVGYKQINRLLYKGVRPKSKAMN